MSKGVGPTSTPLHIYRSSDFGTSWNALTLPASIKGTGSVAALSCSTSTNCIAVVWVVSGKSLNTERAVILDSSDAGSSWHIVKIGTNNIHLYQRIACNVSGTCVAVGRIDRYSTKLQSSSVAAYALLITNFGATARSLTTPLPKLVRDYRVSHDFPDVANNGATWAILGGFPSGPAPTQLDVALSNDLGKTWTFDSVASIGGPAMVSITAAGSRWIAVGANETGGPIIKIQG